jgi:hypothetical protein
MNLRAAVEVEYLQRGRRDGPRDLSPGPETIDFPARDSGPEWMHQERGGDVSGDWNTVAGANELEQAYPWLVSGVWQATPRDEDDDEDFEDEDEDEDDDLEDDDEDEDEEEEDVGDDL